MGRSICYLQRSKTPHIFRGMSERQKYGTYINDDYIGGHTIVEGVDVQPMAGRTVYFDGFEFRHGVSNVLKRDRYTISMWYGKDESMPINDEFLEI